jgi:hypothetical protein
MTEGEGSAVQPPQPALGPGSARARPGLGLRSALEIGPAYR